MTTIATIAFVGQTLAFIARLLMGTHRFLAIKILISATVVALGWALYIGDAPSVWGHLGNIATSFWTLYCWRKNK